MGSLPVPPTFTALKSATNTAISASKCIARERTREKPPIADSQRTHIDGSGLVAKAAARDRVSKEKPMPPLVLSSDSHVFEPPDLVQTRIDAAFRDRAPRIQRIDGADQIVVEADQILSGIGLISNAGARFEAPETISAKGRFEDVLRGGYDPQQHLKDMELDGVAGEVLYPSQGLFYFKVADPLPMSAIFRAYNDWLADPRNARRAAVRGC